MHNFAYKQIENCTKIHQDIYNLILVHHNTEYGIQDFVNELLVMEKGRGCANSAYQHGAPGVKIPSGSWWRKKINYSVVHMEQICDKMLVDTTKTSSNKNFDTQNNKV